MHKVHAGYTLLARLESDGVAEVERLLAGFTADPSGMPFANTTTTHFATITILPTQAYSDEEDLPATLLFATSFCGPVRAHVQELVRELGGPLRALFAACEGFPSDCSDRELERFIREHRRADTFYSGMQHLTPEDVRRQKQLRDEIQTYLDARQRDGGFPDGVEANVVRREIQDHLETVPGFEWAPESCERAPGTFLALHWRSLIALGIALAFAAALVASSIALAIFPGPALGVAVSGGWLAVVVLLIALALTVTMVRDAEREQTHVACRQPDEFVRKLAATQNRQVINEFMVAGPIKEGLFRPVFLRLMLWVVARAAEGIPGIKPFRTGINIATVATARWITCDRGRRLIFISNYTNAAEPYVRDFIDVKGGAKNINVTFGFGRGYPRTRWVIEDGAVTDPNGFIYVVTANQLPTHFWYGPYADMSIDNIKVNDKIRRGLYADLDEIKAQEWLHLL